MDATADMTMDEAGLTEMQWQLEHIVGSIIRIHRIEPFTSRENGNGLRLDISLVDGKTETPGLIATFALPVVRKLTKLLVGDAETGLTLERPIRCEVVAVGKTFDLR